MRMRHLQLQTGLFNSANRYIIFTYRLYTVGFGIVSGFAAVSILGQNLAIGIVNAGVFFDIMVVYLMV